MCCSFCPVQCLSVNTVITSLYTTYSIIYLPPTYMHTSFHRSRPQRNESHGPTHSPFVHPQPAVPWPTSHRWAVYWPAVYMQQCICTWASVQLYASDCVGHLQTLMYKWVKCLCSVHLENRSLDTCTTFRGDSWLAIYHMGKSCCVYCNCWPVMLLIPNSLVSNVLWPSGAGHSTY